VPEGVGDGVGVPEGDGVGVGVPVGISELKYWLQSWSRSSVMLGELT